MLLCRALQVRKQTGVGALALRLNHILVEHIRALLPSLRGHLEAAAAARSAELRRYGASPPGSTAAARCAPVPLRASQAGVGGGVWGGGGGG